MDALGERLIEEGHLLPDHVHMMLSIPPKYAVSQVVGYIKGKSAIHLARVYGERHRGFIGQHFWARGYFVSTVGRDETVIRDYIKTTKTGDASASPLASLSGSQSESPRLCRGMLPHRSSNLPKPLSKRVRGDVGSSLAFRPHAIIATDRSVPSPIFVAALIGVERILRIELDTSLPEQTYVQQALAKLPAQTIAFGRPIGVTVNYALTVKAGSLGRAYRPASLDRAACDKRSAAWTSCPRDTHRRAACAPSNQGCTIAKRTTVEQMPASGQAFNVVRRSACSTAFHDAVWWLSQVNIDARQATFTLTSSYGRREELVARR